MQPFSENCCELLRIIGHRVVASRKAEAIRGRRNTSNVGNALAAMLFREHSFLGNEAIQIRRGDRENSDASKSSRSHCANKNAHFARHHQRVHELNEWHQRSSPEKKYVDVAQQICPSSSFLNTIDNPPT